MAYAPPSEIMDALRRAAEEHDWVTYDRAYGRTNEHMHGCIPLMVLLTLRGQRERLRVILAEFINDDKNSLCDLIKHVGYAAVAFNQYGILKMLMHLTSDSECGPWFRGPDSKRFLGTVLWWGCHHEVPTLRLLKMLDRTREAGYRFDQCDHPPQVQGLEDPQLRGWVQETISLERGVSKG